MSILEKLKAIFDAADQGKWTALGRFHSIAFGVSESDEAIGNVFGIGPKADANINLICQTQNMMPEILADLGNRCLIYPFHLTRPGNTFPSWILVFPLFFIYF